MNYFKKDDLISTLKGHTPFLELKSGESVTFISEYGGRVLGVFPKQNCVNLLWVNPKIKETIRDGQWNIGGDRYWISPERPFFYKHPESWKDWFCPNGLDPANYKITASSTNSCVLSSNISLTNQQNQENYEGIMNRYISLVREPIKTGLPYCGVQYIENCALATPNLKINGWSLAQIISGGIDNPGTVLIPVKRNVKPLSYFRTIPTDRLKLKSNYIAYKIDVSDIYKLAIRPQDIDFNLPAKIGYILKIPKSNEYGFLIKLSSDIPKTQKECFDISRDHPDSEIGVVQSYNSESPNKSELMFGEIELQLASFETVYNSSQSSSRHQLFGYIGTKEEILKVVETYLKISKPELY